jgi:hypothetical protein
LVALDTIERMFDTLSEPGPALAAALDPLVCGDLTDCEVVDAMVAWDRMVSWAIARLGFALALERLPRTADALRAARAAHVRHLGSCDADRPGRGVQ